LKAWSFLLSGAGDGALNQLHPELCRIEQHGNGEAVDDEIQLLLQADLLAVLRLLATGVPAGICQSEQQLEKCVR
jgi:hypothetical protein